MDFSRDPLLVEPIPWQRWLLIHALELRPDGRFRYRTVLILVARQNGKTTIIEVKSLWKMYVLRVLLVIGTAQTLEYAEESWDKAVEIAESIPELEADIAHVDKTNGKKMLKLVGGPRWKIATASRRGGRSLTGDDVNLDELREHLDWLAWGAVTKTTMARPNAQIFAFSNAGDDRSVVLNDLQAKARAAAINPSAADPSLGLFEWSAPDDVKCTCVRPPDEPHRPECRLWDRRAWAQANPSLGYTITEEAIASALMTDPEPIFRTEVLCQRVESLAGKWRVFSEAAWVAREDPLARPAGRPALAVAVTPDRATAAVGAAAPRAGGGRLVDVLEHHPGGGVRWVLSVLPELEQRYDPLVIVINDKALADEAEKAGLKVIRASIGDVAAGAAALYDGIAGPDPVGRDVWHRGRPELTDAAARATTRTIAGTRSWTYDESDPTVDITPLVADSTALWALGTPRIHRPAKRVPMAAYA